MERTSVPRGLARKTVSRKLHGAFTAHRLQAGDQIRRRLDSQVPVGAEHDFEILARELELAFPAMVLEKLTQMRQRILEKTVERDAHFQGAGFALTHFVRLAVSILGASP